MRKLLEFNYDNVTIPSMKISYVVINISGLYFILSIYTVHPTIRKKKGIDIYHTDIVYIIISIYDGVDHNDYHLKF